MDRVGQRRHQGGGPGSGLRLAGDLRLQAAALDQLHGEVGPAVVLAHVVDLDDVGVPQSRHGFRFPEKALPLILTGIQPGEQHLEGNRAVEA